MTQQQSQQNELLLIHYDKSNNNNNNNNNNDFVQQLTYDVLNIIFSYLSFRERIRSTRVSKTWRYFLTSWPHLWNTIADHHVNLDTNLLPYLDYFQGQYVRTVRIPEFSQQSTQFLINQSCRYITTLELPCRPATFVNVHDLLLSTCDSLTDLTIHSGVGNTLLDTILDHCPNLISFQYLLGGSFYNFTGQQQQQQKNNNNRQRLATKIRRLVLDIPLDEQKVLSILSSCPNLSQLQLRSSGMQFGYFDAILMYIHHNHSQLEYLRLFGTSTRHASSLSYQTSFPPLSPPPSSSLTQPQHLRELWLIGTDEGSSTHIIPFAYRHHTTLTSLHIQSPVTPNCMHHLASFPYPALEELYIQLTHYSPHAHDLCQLIRRAPHLIRISLSSFTSTNTVSDQILDVLPSSIQQFKLQQGYNNIVHHDIVTSEGLIRFLKHSISIQEFYLPNVQAFNDNCLDLISSIHKGSLTTLDLYGNEQITDNGLQRFVDNISIINNDNNSKKLQLLNLGQCTLITPNMINYVKNRLPYIKIYN